MGRRRSQVEEESLSVGRRPPNKRNGLLGQHIRLVIRGGVPVVNKLAVFVDLIVEILVREGGMPLRPAGWNVGRIIFIAIQILADEGSTIASAAQPRCDR